MFNYKYLKYKSKYIELKKKLFYQNGGYIIDLNDDIKKNINENLSKPDAFGHTKYLGFAKIPANILIEKELLHFVWVGDPLNSKRDSSLVFFKHLDCFNEINLEIWYWVEDTFTKTDELLLRIHTLSDGKLEGKLKIKHFAELKMSKLIAHSDIENLIHLTPPYFNYIDSIDTNIDQHVPAIFKALKEKKMFNYIKEYLALIIMYIYGGYFLDTTTIIRSRSPNNKYLSLPPFDKTIFITSRTYKYDVYFYYAPKFSRPEQMRLLLVSMLNFYNLLIITSNTHNIYRGMVFKEFKDKLLFQFSEDEYMNDWCIMSLHQFFISGCDTLNFLVSDDDYLGHSALLVAHLNCFLKNLLKIGLPIYNDSAIVSIESFHDRSKQIVDFIPEEYKDLFRKGFYVVDNMHIFIKFMDLSGWSRSMFESGFKFDG